MTEPNTKVILTVTGPSGSGKTELIQEFLSTGLYGQLVSHTTRPMRPGEVNGKDYYFITKPEFEQGLKKNKFVQSVEFHDNLYGTHVDEVERVFTEGKIPIVIVEPTGIGQFIKAFADEGINVESLFVKTSDTFLISRYLQRLVGKAITSDEADYHAERIKAIEGECRSWSNLSSLLSDSLTHIPNDGTIEEFKALCNALAARLPVYLEDGIHPSDALTDAYLHTRGL